MASSRLPDLWTPLATSIPGIKGAVIRHFQKRISALSATKTIPIVFNYLHRSGQARSGREPRSAWR
jgi:hypothetical protein